LLSLIFPSSSSAIQGTNPLPSFIIVLSCWEAGGSPPSFFLTPLNSLPRPTPRALILFLVPSPKLQALGRTAFFSVESLPLPFPPHNPRHVFLFPSPCTPSLTASPAKHARRKNPLGSHRRVPRSLRNLSTHVPLPSLSLVSPGPYRLPSQKGTVPRGKTRLSRITDWAMLIP